MHYGKTIFNINLTDKTISSSLFTNEDVKNILGGFGFNTLYLYKNLLPAPPSALSPDNILIFSTGLLTGSQVPASSRLHINTRSPLSGLIGSSNVGGHIGARLSSLNILSIIVTGKADALSYLLINDSGVTIHDCQYLRQKDTLLTEKELRKIYPDKLTEILSIGVAGENLVNYACIMHGDDHAAGRTGVGAVMGSKNLKAIVVQGVKQLVQKGEDRAKTVIKNYVDSIRSSLPVFEEFSKWGSAAHILPLNEAGELGTRNYQKGYMEGAQKIDGRNLKKYVKKSRSCHLCPVHCKAQIKIEAGRHQGFIGARPEYETIINMGSLCGLDDPEELLYLSNLANILGIDTISTGSVVAFAMELFEKNIITTKDTDGLELKWGDAKAIEKLMFQIANQEGIGKILSKGVKEASEIIGHESEKFAFHAKGVEIYGGDPRGSLGMALTYALSLRGGDFTSIYPIPIFRYSDEQAQEDFGTKDSIDPSITSGKAALIKRCLLVSAVIDSIGLCKVPALSILGRFDLKNESELIKNITGIELSADELFKIGERIINIEKLFNIACGATYEHDTLPDMFQTDELFDESINGVEPKKVRGLADMVQDFYQIMGWDKNGVPTKEEF
ncbi:MAG: aldehyde ferredoxin oxidoreductase family protein [Desulfamplus sp.]|nr:aldehyde ferredoxin oxidoreductase family protein [Desulfamplus sp.]